MERGETEKNGGRGERGGGGWIYSTAHAHARPTHAKPPVCLSPFRALLHCGFRAASVSASGFVPTSRRGSAKTEAAGGDKVPSLNSDEEGSPAATETRASTSDFDDHPGFPRSFVEGGITAPPLSCARCPGVARLRSYAPPWRILTHRGNEG